MCASVTEAPSSVRRRFSRRIFIENGSFAAAARELGKVPSALTYSVRQLEEALDVLLFDRSSRQAQLTAAGTELLGEGRRLLQEMDAVANRVRRVASGWETQLSITIEDLLSLHTVFELVEAFCQVRETQVREGKDAQGPEGPATRLRLRTRAAACCDPKVHPLAVLNGPRGVSDWRGQHVNDVLLSLYAETPAPPPGDALRRLSGSLIDAREEERRRISRELHDELGQRLSALKMGMVGLSTELHGRASQKQLEAMVETLDGIVAAMRRIAADLRPLMLDDLGLNAAVEWLARESARRLGLEVSVELDDYEPPADHRMATALYRMVQEALANIGNHAEAQRAWIALHHVGNELQLTVRDDGIGFPSPMPTRDDSFGLLGMSERAALLGGRLVLDNAPEGGARVRVYLPLSSGYAADPARVAQ